MTSGLKQPSLWRRSRTDQSCKQNTFTPRCIPMLIHTEAEWVCHLHPGLGPAETLIIFFYFLHLDALQLHLERCENQLNPPGASRSRMTPWFDNMCFFFFFSFSVLLLQGMMASWCLWTNATGWLSPKMHNVDWSVVMETDPLFFTKISPGSTFSLPKKIKPAPCEHSFSVPSSASVSPGCQYDVPPWGPPSSSSSSFFFCVCFF